MNGAHAPPYKPYHFLKECDENLMHKGANITASSELLKKQKPDMLTLT